MATTASLRLEIPSQYWGYALKYTTTDSCNFLLDQLHLRLRQCYSQLKKLVPMAVMTVVFNTFTGDDHGIQVSFISPLQMNFEKIPEYFHMITNSTVPLDFE
jgi:hypothetical protein